MGDKTRMVHLSTDPNAYVRPSPTRGSLGGIGKNTSEAIILCESAGYNVILVETVGVGQSEIAVDNLVDMFILLVPPAGGDELQGIKKGVMEMADLVVINKADGDLMRSALKAQYEYMSALKILTPKDTNWSPQVVKCSSVTQEGIPKIWELASGFLHAAKQSGSFLEKRSKQQEHWMWNMIYEGLESSLLSNPLVQKEIPKVINLIHDGKLTPYQASSKILEIYFPKDK
eukprot:TRINITY_DN6051_c0_g1_i15.p1 TRINITY_DN6051_c0_g1~~TRINITY_DN6051_c0_g1_i15.p1  ORF type:complete len:230 (+),score=57.13 TRINITY_DN6051_c0_g1_i15:624-1313(+)